jgi:molybdopterin molybdotransferase
MRGETAIFRRAVDVRLAEDLAINAPLTHFMRAIVDWDAEGGPTARLTGPQGSGLLTSMSRANALVVVPPERPTMNTGEMARALPLGEGFSSSMLDL